MEKSPTVEPSSEATFISTDLDEDSTTSSDQPSTTMSPSSSGDDTDPRALHNDRPMMIAQRIRRRAAREDSESESSEYRIVKVRRLSAAADTVPELAGTSQNHVIARPVSSSTLAGMSDSSSEGSSTFNVSGSSSSSLFLPARSHPSIAVRRQRLKRFERRRNRTTSLYRPVQAIQPLEHDVVDLTNDSEDELSKPSGSQTGNAISSEHPWPATHSSRGGQALSRDALIRDFNEAVTSQLSRREAATLPTDSTLRDEGASANSSVSLTEVTSWIPVTAATTTTTTATTTEPEEPQGAVRAIRTDISRALPVHVHTTRIYPSSCFASNCDQLGQCGQRRYRSTHCRALSSRLHENFNSPMAPTFISRRNDDVASISVASGSSQAAATRTGLVPQTEPSSATMNYTPVSVAPYVNLPSHNPPTLVQVCSNPTASSTVPASAANQAAVAAAVRPSRLNSQRTMMWEAQQARAELLRSSSTQAPHPSSSQNHIYHYYNPPPPLPRIRGNNAASEMAKTRYLGSPAVVPPSASLAASSTRPSTSSTIPVGTISGSIQATATVPSEWPPTLSSTGTHHPVNRTFMPQGRLIFEPNSASSSSLLMVSLTPTPSSSAPSPSSPIYPPGQSPSALTNLQNLTGNRNRDFRSRAFYQGMLSSHPSMSRARLLRAQERSGLPPPYPSVSPMPAVMGIIAWAIDNFTVKYNLKPDDIKEGVRCSICLTDYEVEDEVRRLPCMHLFHAACIDQWFRSDKRCPMCRVDITKRPEDEFERIEPPVFVSSPITRTPPVTPPPLTVNQGTA